MASYGGYAPLWSVDPRLHGDKTRFIYFESGGRWGLLLKNYALFNISNRLRVIHQILNYKKIYA
jgi:hypothetical protein